MSRSFLHKNRLLSSAGTSAVFIAETFFTGELARSKALVLFGLALPGVLKPHFHAGNRYFISLAFPLASSENRHFGAFHRRSLALVGGEITLSDLWTERL